MKVYVDRFGRIEARRARLLRAAHAALRCGLTRTIGLATGEVVTGNRWGGPQSRRMVYSAENHVKYLEKDRDIARADELGRRMRDTAWQHARAARVNWYRDVTLDFAALLKPIGN